MIKERNKILDKLKENLTRAQERMKHLANINRREVELEVGQQVYLKLQPYRFRSLASKPNEKLSPHFYGPYEVEERIGAVAYRLKLPKSARVSGILHKVIWSC